MKKVHILDRCEYSDGQAYVFVGKRIDAAYQSCPRYQPCSHCLGSGEMDNWVSSREFADLLERAIALETNWQELKKGIKCY